MMKKKYAFLLSFALILALAAVIFSRINRSFPEETVITTDRVPPGERMDRLHESRPNARKPAPPLQIPEFRKPAEAFNAPINYAAKAAVAEDPEMREYAIRRITKDYAELFAELRLPEEIENLMTKMLVERALSPEFEEMAQYDIIAKKLLTPDEYLKFSRYRDDIPNVYAVQAALSAVGQASGGSVDGYKRTLVDRIVRSAPNNGDVLWQEAADRAKSATLPEAEYSKLATIAIQRFEATLTTNADGLSEDEKNKLRGWYQANVIEFNLRALRNSHPIRGSGG